MSTTIVSTVRPVVRALFPVSGISKRSTVVVRRHLETMATMSRSAVAKATSVCVAVASQIEESHKHLVTRPSTNTINLATALQLSGLNIDGCSSASAVDTDAVGIATVCGQRNKNEDRTLVRRLSSDLLLVGIFDGHAGSEAADFVCDRLPDILNYWLEHDCGDLQVALRHAFVDVNDQLTDVLSGRLTTFNGRVPAVIRSPSCGTTATVCVIRRDSQLVVAHVGDSRATLCRSGVGQILTVDHSPDDPRELERILQCSGHVTQTSVGRPRVNGILEMTRSIGDVRLKQYGVTAEPDIVTIELDSSTDEYLTLTTDGIHNTLNADEIIDAVSNSADATDAASAVAEDALRYGSTDNCTALVLPLAAWNCSPSSRDVTSSRVVKFRRAHYTFGNRV